MPRSKKQAKHLIKARNQRKSTQLKNSYERYNAQIEESLSESSDNTIEENYNEINENIQNNNELNDQENFSELDNNMPIVGELNDNIIEKKRVELIKIIKSLPDFQVERALFLLTTMVYPKGKHAGEILSPYLQKKAYEFIEAGLYKQGSTIAAIKQETNFIKKENNQLKKAVVKSKTKIHSLNSKVVRNRFVKTRQISKMRSAIQKTKKSSSQQFQKTIKKAFKVIKKEYSSQFVKLATEISNTGHNSINSTVESTRAVYEFLTGEKPTVWISASTLAKWNKEVAQISLEANLSNSTNLPFYGYGIMVDESTRGEKKILIICIAHWNQEKDKPVMTVIKMEELTYCNGKSVALAVLNSCNENGLNSQLCHFWLTDNTAYMSAEKKGAVIQFNLMANAKSFRIPCGIHAAQIALMNFENIAFGKLDSQIGLSLKEHPYNLLNLAFYLHNGYNESNADNPLNINTKIIQQLYKELLGYDLTQYQKPIRQRWLYELQAAKQYFERHEIHLQFAQWFIKKLHTIKKAPQKYIEK